MNTPSTNSAGLSTLDSICRVMDSPQRPLDFTLVLQLKQAPDVEALKAGAKSARNLYATTGSYIDGKHWVRFAEPEVGVRAVEADSNAMIAAASEAFVDGPFDPCRQVPVQQLLIVDGTGGKAKLLTRFHHAAADYMSALMWLRHQLGVAAGDQAPTTAVAPFQELPLRQHPAPIKKSPFAYRGPTQRLRSQGARPSRARRWHSIEVPAAELRSRSSKLDGFTYNDLLTTCALEAFVHWNQAGHSGRGRKVGLLMPINIRQRPFEGFGNGASRIRIYARYADDARLLDKCRQTRRQVAWCKEHGEWAVPPSHPLIRLPAWAGSPLLRCYLKRPWVDVATGVFSHAERWDGQDDELFQNVEKIEFIGQLHERHAVVLNAATLRDQTWLTFTCDPALLSSAELQNLIAIYQEQIALAQRELQ
jgi:hypothetical protein